MNRATSSPLKKKRGISLLEAVICLTVITLVSTAFVSIAMIFSKEEIQNTTHLQAISYSESIVECFRYCESNEDMENALTLLDGSFVKVESDEKDTDSASYRLEKKAGYVINVTTSFAQNKLEIQVADNNGNEINRITYEKY